MNPSSESNSRAIWWICFGAIAIVSLTAALALPQISDLLMDADSDDLMRLVEVRDWVAGQAWFDTRQYRVLPPEGISMHWSRYVDAGIAAVLQLASWLLPPTQAELATVILWPSLLACLMVLVIGHATARLMGNAAAIGALATFLSWGKLRGEFVPPRIDHHNVQLLCATAIFYLALIPGRPRLLGALAGALTALSLAVGLEMLPYLAVIWGTMALRHAFARPSVGEWLLGFGAAIALAAPLLMAGQVPRSGWWINHCDVLAPPVLTLAAIGVTATLVPVFAAQVLKGPVTRILAMLAITTAGLMLAWPLLGPCLAGPYADVPQTVRSIIETRIIEALSARTLLNFRPELLLRILLPAVAISLLALAAAMALRARISEVQAAALTQSFVVIGVGLVFATAQIRAANLLAPALPLVGGFLVHAFTLIPRTSPLRAPAVIVLLLAMPAVVERGVDVFFQHAPVHIAQPADQVLPLTPQATGSNCRNPAAMAEIASLPTSVIFPTLNLGTAIIAYTPHAVTSAPYHRSPAAFWNGTGAFETEGSLQDALSKTGADYIVICAGSKQERALHYVESLLSGNLPDWIVDVTEERKQVRVYKVDKDALHRAGGAE